MLRRLLTLLPLLAIPCLAQVVIIDARWPRIPAPMPQPVRAAWVQRPARGRGRTARRRPRAAARTRGPPGETLSVSGNAAAAAPVRTVYSPTHQMDITRPDAPHAASNLSLRDIARPDD